MNKKAFVVILILSVVVTIGIPIIGFITNTYQVISGWPFEFTSFSLLGSSTDYATLLLNIAFWFVVILVIWKTFLRLVKR